jgi:arginine-tRNA-protein transferase
MRVLQQFVTDPHTCPYLADRDATMEYSYAPVMSPAEYEDLMNRGYRKFGPLFFRPVCSNCTACRPLRIPIAEFRPDRSQRRCWNQNQDLEVRAASPSMDPERLELYHRYHRAQHQRRGWSDQQRDPEDYEFSYLRNPIPSVELTLWKEGQLLAVVLTDITPNVVSGIYHYWDPDYADRGLGTYCMLHTLDLARRLEKRWAYFGYHVSGCRSLEYKARFRPCELMDEAGVWQPMETLVGHE